MPTPLSTIKLYLKLYSYVCIAKIFRRKWTWFNDDEYQNKRIIIIGPASSSLEYLPGKEIDAFDIIIRVNKSPLTIKGKEYQLGTRTDILYHCCDEDPITGGGQINPELLHAQGTKSVIYTYHEKYLTHNFFRSIIKHSSVRFNRTHSKLYLDLKREYKAKTPTTGLQALNHVLQCNFLELHITGFTFFKTAYTDGYRDEHKSAEMSTALAVSKGNHDPDDELRLFRKIYNSQINSKHIIIDRTIEKLIASAE